MSVNITVNGKFTKNCLGHPLADPQRVKKELEEERRKVRIKQVRVQSSNLARKLRDDVAKEKARQLRRLEEMKSQELNCWREHVLASKNADFRQAVFQVGQAHCAAMAENEYVSQVKPQSYKDFRKKLKARRSGDSTENRQKSSLPDNKVLKSSCTQTTQPNCTRTTDEIRTTKRKRGVCCAGRTCCCCSCDSRSEDFKCTDYDSDINIEVKDICTSSDDDEELSEDMTPGDEDESEENITVIPAVKRKEMSTINEEVSVEDLGTDSSEPSFHRAARTVSPQKSVGKQSQRDVRLLEKSKPPATAQPAKSPSKTIPMPARQRQIPPRTQSPPKTVSASAQRKQMPPRTQSPQKDMPPRTNQGPIAQRRSPARATSAAAKSLPAHTMPHPTQPKPQTAQRAPQLAQTKAHSTTPQQKVQGEQSSPKKSRSYNPRDFEEPSETEMAVDEQRFSQLTSFFSRKEQQQHAVVKDTEAPTRTKRTHSPAKINQTPTCRCCPDCALSLRGQTISSTTVTLCRCHTADNKEQRPSSSQVAPVRYYDYNNKFSKEYPQPTKSVHLVRENYMRTNANEQANIERRSLAASGEEAAQLRKRADERGKRALERESVRRDCLDLTEKLELLLQKHPQLLPSDANLVQRHRAANAAALKETKMNSAVEEILMRPAVITCPDVQVPGKPVVIDRPATQKASQAINLGSPPNSASISDSCSSILLGYVNDQSKQLRNELSACEPQQSQGDENEKKAQLKRLLQRTEQLRETLLQEIRSGAASSSDVEKVRQVLDCISKLRTERESISNTGAQTSDKPQSAREKQLHLKEKVLEQKIREFCEMQAAANNEDFSGVRRTKPDDKPIEIVIKFKNETCIQKRQLTRTKVVKGVKRPQSPPQVQATETPKSTEQPNAIEQHKSATQDEAARQQTSNQQPVVDQHQASPSSSSETFNSASTHYRSLPPRIRNSTEINGERPSKEDENTRDKFMGEETALYSDNSVAVEVDNPETIPVNSLLAKYIQRLLGMTRESINTLDMSSSEIETPSTSIINAAGNVSHTASDERLTHVKKFIDENRAFVGELEESLRSAKTNNDTIRATDQIWKQLLLNSAKAAKMERQKQAAAKAEKTFKSPKAPAPKAKPAGTRSNVSTGRKSETSKRPNSSVAQHKRHEATQPNKSIPQKPPAKPAPKNLRSISIPATSREKTDRRKKHAQPLIEEVDENYDKMSEICTHRIASLTDKLNKVRAEKQRILEMTLSSVSSTDYRDLPQNKSGPKSKADSEDTSSLCDVSDSRLLDSNLINEMVTSSGEHLPPECTPLEKHKATGKSQDSGISMSRPVTAQGQHYDFEPPSYASSNTQSTSQRKQKPPATIRRFSPQLVEEDFAHELSTIMEVETPCNSRVTTSIQPGTSRGQANSTRTDAQSSYCGCTDETSYIEQGPCSPSKAAGHFTRQADSTRFATETTRHGLTGLRKPDESSYMKQRPNSPSAGTSRAAPETTHQRGSSAVSRRADATGYRGERPRSPSPTTGYKSRQAALSRSPTEASRQAETSRLAPEKTHQRGSSNVSRRADATGYREERPRSPSPTTGYISRQAALSRSPTEASRQAETSRLAPEKTHQRGSSYASRRADATGYREERPRSPSPTTGYISRQADLSRSPTEASRKANASSYMDQRPSSPRAASNQRTRQADSSRCAAERSPQRELPDTSRNVDTSRRVNTAGYIERPRPQRATYAPIEYAGQQTISAGTDCTCGPQGFMSIQQPEVFPTFEQYTCNMNLDLTQLDVNQSWRLKQEYEELMGLVQQAQGKSAPNFEAFPSMTAYLQNITNCDAMIDSGVLFNGHTFNSVEDLINSMRQLNQSIKGFPTHKSYRQQNQRTQSSDDDLIDTNSLENFTTGPSSSDSNTMNIEEELQRRKLITKPFSNAKTRERVFASTAHENSPENRCFPEMTATESGIDPLTSTGTNSSQAYRRRDEFGMKDWSTIMRQRAKDAAALSSNTTSLSPYVNSSVAPELTSYYGNYSTDEPEARNAYVGQYQREPVTSGHNRMHSTRESGGHHSNQDPFPQQSQSDPQKGMNLREFLTKELLRHANSPGTGSNTDDSLRSQFFHSIIGFLTPTGSPRSHCQHSTNHKKTSTPVCSSSSPSRTRSGRPQHSSGPLTSTHLFSGESQMSSVHYEDPIWEGKRDLRSS